MTLLYGLAMNRVIRLPILTALLALLLVAARPALADTTLTCGVIPELMRVYFESHIQFQSLSAELEQRTIDSYLRRLDSSRSLLLKSEAQELQATLARLFAAVDRGDCDLLRQTHAKIVERHRTMTAFAKELVERPDYAIDYGVKLVLDPEERGFPATVEEQRRLQERLVHFQMSNYVSAGTELGKAKAQLVQRYERVHKELAELSEADIFADFLDAFAMAFDPHSSYLPAEALEDFRIMMGLSLEGIGVELSAQDGYITVERILPGGPAARLGRLEPKDKIVAVTQESGEPVNVIDMPLREVVRLIRGKKGTPVQLTILRQGETTERFSIRIVRDTISLEEQAAKVRFEKAQAGDRALKLAVLELPSFYGDQDPRKHQALDDVRRLLREVRREKADGLVLDLSRNGGGLLDYAVAISGLFIHSGAVVAVQNAGIGTQVLPDPDDGIEFSGPLVVLTSRMSASASEILAGAIKDYDRGVIVGDQHTFGKGSVQNMMPLPRGLGAVKVTTGMFFRPGGASTQHAGVAADVVIPSVTDMEEIGEASEPYSLPPQTRAPFLSKGANRPGKAHWQPVSDELITELAARSRGRVDKDAELQRVRKELDVAKARNGVIELREIVREQEAHQKAEEKQKDGQLSPQAREALNVLADLVVRGGGAGNWAQGASKEPLQQMR